MISCLTITREGRLDLLKRAAACFESQTHEDRELVVVHDGPGRFHDELTALLDPIDNERIQVHRLAPDLSLGALRNASIDRAAGEIVCQWDDDDLYHPQRLEIQLEALEQAGADFCFLTDQLHYFEPTGELFWDDWQVERYPGNLIQGTILGLRAKLPGYEALPRGEDTKLHRRLVAEGCRLTGLSGYGYLYLYVYNDRNAWDIRHHAGQSAWKRLRGAALRDREADLRRELARYDLPWDRIFMPCEGGAVEIR